MLQNPLSLQLLELRFGRLKLFGAQPHEICSLWAACSAVTGNDKDFLR
jgi:hypothetical protein